MSEQFVLMAPAAPTLGWEPHILNSQILQGSTVVLHDVDAEALATVSALGESTRNPAYPSTSRPPPAAQALRTPRSA